MKVNHISVPATDYVYSATLMAELLDKPTRKAGPEDKFILLPINETFTLHFFKAIKVDRIHVAFQVNEQEFDDLIKRLDSKGLPYGNEPGDPRNKKTDGHLIGAKGVFFLDPDKHLWEFFY